MQNGTIGEICNRDVVVASRDMTVAAAAQLMRHDHVGTLVVCDRLDGGRRVPVGIVTDRDIVVEVVAPNILEVLADELTDVSRIVGRERSIEAANRR